MRRTAYQDNQGQATLNFEAIKPWIAAMIGNLSDRRFNILHYGAQSTPGFDNTPAIRRTIAAADAAGGGLVYVPQSNYGFNFRPYDEEDGVESLLVLTFPPGVGLVGDGYSSVLRFIVDDYDITDGHYCGLMLEGNNAIRDIRLDGNKANLSLSGDKIFYGYHAAENASHITFQDLWIHNIPSSGSTKESFGILLNTGVNTVYMSKVRAYDNAGSGISVNGNNPHPALEGDNGAGDIILSDCDCWGNGWQGITCYAIHGVLIDNCHCWNNLRYGFNAEWASVRVKGSEFAYSTLGNFRVMGGTSNLVASDCYIHGSAATNEIVIQAGGFHRQFVAAGARSSENITRWLLGIEFPATGTTGDTLARFLLDVYPNDGEVEEGESTWPIGMPQYVEFNNCTVIRGVDELGAGYATQHLQVRSVEAFVDEVKGQLTLYGDRSYPRVVLNCHDAADWQITGWIYHREEPAVRSLVPGLEFPLLRTHRTIALNPLSMWDWGGTIDDADSLPYDGTDAMSDGAWTIITDTAESDFFSYPGYAIDGGRAGDGFRKYHVKARVKVTQPTGATIDDPDVWGVNISRKGGVGGLALNLVFGSMEDDGQWVEAEGVAFCGPGQWRVVVFYGERATSASEDGRIDIDYITVTEVSSRQMQSDYDRQNYRHISAGNGLPTTGTFHKGHIHVNTSTGDGHPTGWLCHEGGTYGATSCTGDTTASSTSVQSTGGVHAGEYVTIAGASRLDAQGSVFQIVNIDPANVITTDSAPNATLNDAVIQYSVPVWSELFPAAQEMHLSSKPVGSRSALATPQDDSTNLWLLDAIMYRNIPRFRLIKNTPGGG